MPTCCLQPAWAGLGKKVVSGSKCAEHPGLGQDLCSGMGLLSMALNFIKALAGTRTDKQAGKAESR